MNEQQLMAIGFIFCSGQEVHVLPGYLRKHAARFQFKLGYSEPRPYLIEFTPNDKGVALKCFQVWQEPA